MSERPTHASPGATAVRTLQWGQHALFTLLLAVALGIAVVRRDDEPGWVIPVAIALCAFYGLGIRLARAKAQRVVGWLWLAGLVGLWIPLALASPGFRWLSFAIFLLALHLAPIPAALLLVAAMTALVVGMGMADTPQDPSSQVLGPIIGAVVAVGVAAGYRAVLAESRARAQLVLELQDAHAAAERLSDELARSQRESGALAERTRIARDIHDTLAQGFSSLVLLARAQRAVADAEAWRRVEAIAGDNLTEARRVVQALSPAALDDTPLADALGRLAAVLAAEAGMEARVVVEGTPRPVPTAVEVAVLRVAQGALANVRAHSGARRCVVTLGYEPSHLALDVVDDGVGFDPAHVPASAGGFGLRGTRERIEALGGTVSIESSPGDGAAVAIRIPTRETP